VACNVAADRASSRYRGNSPSATGYVFDTDYLTDASGTAPVIDSQGRFIPRWVPGETLIEHWFPTRGAELNVDTGASYLRDRWALRLAQNPKCRILHSADPAQSCGIGFLAFNGVDAGKMREALWNKHAILTAYMPHEEYSGLRVTANVYSTLRDIDSFSQAVETEVKNG
jgi:hypothetical protein